MKTQIFFYSLLFLAFFGLNGCTSSDEPFVGGNALAGGPVTFNAETALTKKIYYGTPNSTSIPIYWGSGDKVKTYSSQSTTISKSAIYKADKGGAEHASFSLFTGETALTWNNEGTAQSFCSFFPSADVSFVDSEGSVQASVNLPSEYDLDYNSNFMVGYQYTATDPVELQFVPLTNLIRLTITDDALGTDPDHTISSIVVKSKEATPKKLAGSFTIIYPSASVDNLSASSFTYDLSAADADSILITGGRLDTFAKFGGSLTIPISLLPQDYGPLEITLYTFSGKSHITKTAFSSTTFAQSSVCDLSFGNLDGLVSSGFALDLGCPVGGDLGLPAPLYFAATNLVVEKTWDGFSGRFANAPSFVALSSNYSMDSYDMPRDLFGWGDVTGWNTSVDDMDYTSNDDVATALLGSSWRLPTQNEWMWVSAHCSCVWTDDYEDTGVAGAIITGCNESYYTWDGADHSNVTLFLPAAGYRDGTNVLDDGMACYYSMASTSGGTFPPVAFFASYSFNLETSKDREHVWRGISVRPVKE